MSDTQKRALITGATRGIGREIMLTLARAGYHVVGTATTPAGVEKINAALATDALSGYGACLNVAEASMVDDFFKKLDAAGHMPDILVNNAGITRDNLLLRMKAEEWDAVINTNLTAIYRLSKHCIKFMMKKRWGRIISIASVTGLMGNAGQVNYSATKAGLIGFSKSLAREVASRNITINVVAPGFIESDMTDALTPAQQEAVMTMIPLGHIGTPIDIAEGVAYLASDKAGYITGETLNINGGMLMV